MDDRNERVPCADCDGEGWIEYTPMAGTMHYFTEECATCGGTGWLTS